VSPRPLIFISAVSRELRSARQLVANTLTFLGYEPVWQEIFGTESGDLRDILRQQIDQCNGVVQLVGQCYGAEPPVADERFGRVSYTQFEALYARAREKKVWYLFIDEHFPIDRCEDEPEEVRALQATYRRRLQADSHVFHPLTSAEGLEASVLKLRDDLAQLRRGAKRWAAAVAILLVVSVAIGFWLLRGQSRTVRQMGETKQAVAVMTEEMSKLRQGIMQYTQVETKVRQSGSGEDAPAVQERVYVELGKQLDLDPTLVREKLPQVAESLQRAPDATNYERANAAYVAKDYPEAERVSLQAAEEAKQTTEKPGDAVNALKLAGLSAQKRIEYANAMTHFRDAEKLTDRGRNAEEWAEVQHAIADLLLDQGRYNDAEKTLRSVMDVRTQRFGPEHPETLRSHNRLAYAIWRQGRFKDAQADFRQIVALQEKVLGPENPDTLLTRNGLALALDDEGKHSEAEAEHRQILRIREKVLGAEHPDTLRSRNNLALCLNRQGKYAEAETNFRQLIELEERILGAEHPDTLRSRSNLIVALGNQRKDSEAEAQFRELINLEEKVLGPQHPDTLRARSNLAYSLARQGKYAEAESHFRDVIETEKNALGPEHPATLGSRSGLSSVLTSQEKYTEAEAECRELIPLDEKVFGPEHPSTLEACYTLAYALARQNKMLEAKMLARRAADGAAKGLGATHPSTQKYVKLLQDLRAH
jgi:tetratricopeptide (TPR) repeat protein